MKQNEDLDYNFTGDDSAGGPDPTDPDFNNLSLLKRHLRDVNGWIAKHNSFDAIDLHHSKLNSDQQVEMHKHLVGYLRQFKSDLELKIEELSDGR